MRLGVMSAWPSLLGGRNGKKHYSITQQLNGRHRHCAFCGENQIVHCCRYLTHPIQLELPIIAFNVVIRLHNLSIRTCQAVEVTLHQD